MPTTILACWASGPYGKRMNTFSKRLRRFCLALVLGMLGGWGMLASAALAGAGTVPAKGFVARITLDGAVGPATAEYFHTAVRRAARDGARVIVLQIDTPGGLMAAMRGIISDILAAPIPVIGYVAPAGARAASAGTYILYATHIAAMAPATHLGAATPVSLGGTTPLPLPRSPLPGTTPELKKKSATRQAPSAKAPDAEQQKALNDAIAYIRSLAQLRGRNVEWAEQAVRGAATLTAAEALNRKVVDIVAPDVASLLRQADGRKVAVGKTTTVLSGLAGLPVRDYSMNARLRFLSVITNPTVAYGLLLIGIWGLALEGFHPGAILPGTVGAISLLVALYALHLLPVNFAGLALILLGLGMIVAEVLVPTVGAIGLGGVVAFVMGSVMLFDASVPGYGVNLGVIAALAVFSASLLFLVLWLLMRSRRRRPTIGAGDELVGATGVLMEALPAGGETWAVVHGERWRVQGSAALMAGARVRVVARDGLILTVAAV